MSPQKKSELFNKEFLIENIEAILTMPDYLPFVLRSVLKEISVNYSQTIENRSLQKYYIHRKKVYSKLYNQNKAEVFHLSELLVFVFKYPQFEKMIKDDDILEEWVDYCENIYNLDVLHYSNEYDDIEILLKKED